MKSIFTTEASWKVTQVKTKFILLTFVRSEEDDPLELMPLNIYLLYHLLWGLSQYFLLLGHVIVSEWGFKLNAKAQVLAPTIAPQNFNFSLSSKEKKYNFDVHT